MAERWKTYGVNRLDPGVTYYQGDTDAPEGEWLVRESEVERLREALREIRDADPVDMALDPGWAARIARLAFDEERAS